eukprot:CAMPEP_0185356342 /NCGR_PEP_ID=MMETSP1364-20130426/6672_1 /TAXON_ID=38817 /ORGANISM="Gephyrocapsa oceanica, Strain RCC1303" /LENGTH=62 /DNA_ID=CAMNT_0027956263 /DNA_START=25 /DNA_END=209 /DNA_ORIENTATION=+
MRAPAGQAARSGRAASISHPGILARPEGPVCPATSPAIAQRPILTGTTQKNRTTARQRRARR